MNITKTYNLIGVHGRIGSGKDTLTSYVLRRVQGWAQYAFAQPIKDAARVMFNFSETQLYGTPAQKAEVDEFWGFSPRTVFQKLGTDFGRNMLRDDVWLKRAEAEVAKNRAAGVGTIISDVRFENEAELVRRLGGVVLHVEPPVSVSGVATHASEAGIEFAESDLRITNDKTLGLESFYKLIDAQLLGGFDA